MTIIVRMRPIERADIKHGMEVWYTGRATGLVGPFTVDKGMLETCLINNNKVRRNIEAWPNVDFWVNEGQI